LFSEPLGFLAYATRNPVTVALIDIWTPGMSSLELQKELRAVSPETRVIVVSADDEDSVRSVAMKNDATAFFAKPFDMRSSSMPYFRPWHRRAEFWFDRSASRSREPP
jgi:DNA-binding NarL/FixJ family response regulator